MATAPAQAPRTFNDFCKMYGIRHYADERTYKAIESSWRLIYKKMKANGVVFSDYMELMNYLWDEHDASEPKYRFIHWYIISEFGKYQSTINQYAQHQEHYNIRLIGYAAKRTCKNIKDLQRCLNASIKRVQIDDKEPSTMDARDFLLTARYICDYLQDYPEDTPKGLFRV
jgi:hypothetical protein